MAPPTRRRQAFDAVSYLTIFLVLLFGMSSRYVVGPLGGAGSPAELVGLGALGWWTYHRLQAPETTYPKWQPIRIALFALAVAFLVSYAVAMSRPIAADESSDATLGMVSLASWLGISLLAHDGIVNQSRLDQLTRRVILGTGLMALLGIAQFLLHDAIVDGITVPGLRANLPVTGLVFRSGYVRPTGTALHPIEFGAILTSVLPLAIARVRTSPRDQRATAIFWLAAIALAVFLCGSRSAILSAVVGVLLMMIIWSPQARIAAGAVIVLLGGLASAVAPGITGTLLGLFTGFGDDGSVLSRTGSYQIVGAFFKNSPWAGRGFSTFLPVYRILDNEYLLLVIEVGLIGLAAFLAVLCASAGVAITARRQASNQSAREQLQALAAGIVAAAVGLGTYDGLSFPTATGLLFLILGITGAAARITLHDAETTTDRARPPYIRRLGRPLLAKNGDHRHAHEHQ